MALDEVQVSRLRFTLQELGLGLPKAVRDAEARHAVADRHVETLTAEPEPALAGVAIEQIARRIEELAEFSIRHDARVRAARALERQIAQETAAVWSAAAEQILELLRPPFDDAAAAITATRAALQPYRTVPVPYCERRKYDPDAIARDPQASEAWHTMTSAVRTLTYLSAARDSLADALEPEPSMPQVMPSLRRLVRGFDYEEYAHFVSVGHWGEPEFLVDLLEKMPGARLHLMSVPDLYADEAAMRRPRRSRRAAPRSRVPAAG